MQQTQAQVGVMKLERPGVFSLCYVNFPPQKNALNWQPTVRLGTDVMWLYRPGTYMYAIQPILIVLVLPPEIPNLYCVLVVLNTATSIN